MLIYHHHQNHHSLSFVIRCVHIKYILLLSFISLGISSVASLVLHFHGKTRLFFVWLVGFFWSGFLQKFQVILKSKQTFYFNKNAFLS